MNTIAFALLTACHFCTAGRAEAPQSEEPTIRKTLADFADAWNRHDAARMAALHTALERFREKQNELAN